VTDWYRFYRAGLCCALHYDEDKDMYFGYIGVNDEHPFYGSSFKVVNGASLHKYNVKFGRDVLDDLWWMGFHKQTTYDKALQTLKMIADSVGPDSKKVTPPPKSGGFSLL